MRPATFVHNRTGDKFIGHFAGHDVYRAKDSLGDSLIARYGDKPCEYASGPICVLFQSVGTDERIGNVPYEGESMRFEDYLFTPYICEYCRAMVLAILYEAKEFQND